MGLERDLFAEFVSQTGPHLWAFALYTLSSQRDQREVTDEALLQLWKETQVPQINSASEPHAKDLVLRQWKLHLFRHAIASARKKVMRPAVTAWGGRDLRPLKKLDSPLLQLHRNRNSLWTDPQVAESVLERLRALDWDLRLILVLYDVLHFSAQEVQEILGLRWGVCRHRLHRARMECKELLKGHETQVAPHGTGAPRRLET